MISANGCDFRKSVLLCSLIDLAHRQSSHYLSSVEFSSGSIAFRSPLGFDSLRDRGFSNLIAAEQCTNVGNSRSLDNIWYRPAGAIPPPADTSADLAPELEPLAPVRSFSGHCGVVRRGLEHPFIPGGRSRGNWGWNGVPSDHCPVWAEFYVDAEEDSG